MPSRSHSASRPRANRASRSPKGPFFQDIGEATGLSTLLAQTSEYMFVSDVSKMQEMWHWGFQWRSPLGRHSQGNNGSLR
jgi:hypothetical protein